ncbi:hypothetical protein CW708_01705 [Candidatus Bathyarchaeota archaeon]|nr:MAG: hypothetical protein CW708_01705 [Candidatus Bathyarchaeota archaeon]
MGEGCFLHKSINVYGSRMVTKEVILNFVEELKMKTLEFRNCEKGTVVFVKTFWKTSLCDFGTYSKKF